MITNKTKRIQERKKQRNNFMVKFLFYHKMLKEINSNSNYITILNKFNNTIDIDEKANIIYSFILQYHLKEWYKLENKNFYKLLNKY